MRTAIAAFALVCAGKPGRGEDKKPVEPTEEQLKAAKEAFAKVGIQYHVKRDLKMFSPVQTRAALNRRMNGMFAARSANSPAPKSDAQKNR